MPARTAPDLLPAPGQHDAPQPCWNLHLPGRAATLRGPICNIFTFGKYPARVPQIPPGGLPDTPAGFIDPIPGDRDIRISRLCGLPTANYHRAIMRQQEPPALSSGFFVPFPEAARTACGTPSGNG